MEKELNNLVKDLKGDIWDKISYLYPIVGNPVNKKIYNLKNIPKKYMRILKINKIYTVI